MGYWGWRPLAMLFCFSVWVVSCSDPAEFAPDSTPTNLPIITLTKQHSPRGPTRAGPLLQLETLLQRPTVVQSTLDAPPQPTPIPLELLTPSCYELRSGGVTCLGLVENTQQVAVQGVVLETQLLDRGGATLREVSVTLNQRLLLPGETAPYRALFPPADVLYLADDVGGVRTTLRRAESVSEPAPVLPLQVEAQTETIAGDEDRINVTVRNTTTTDVALVRVVVTLLDDAERVIAYRVTESGALPAGEGRTIGITLLPFIESAEQRVRVYAEGEP